MWILLAVPAAFAVGYYLHDKFVPKAKDPPSPTITENINTNKKKDDVSLQAQAASQKILEENASEKTAADAAAQIIQSSTNEGVGQQAEIASDAIKQQILDAMNTPEGERSPEQSALLNSIAGLPDFK